MSIYKSLSPDDISRLPFNANKQFSFTSASSATSSIGILFQEFKYTASILDTFSSESTDSVNTIKYHQLDHLFYKDNRLDISNKLGDADYLHQPRNLYNSVNVLSIPSRLFGNKIKPGTFTLSSSEHNNATIIDDTKGNLLISGTNLISHSIDEREKVLFVGPIKAFKQYDLNYNLYGLNDPNSISYYNNENVYDDSYYNNTVTYKNITFDKENYDTYVSGSKINFHRDVSSSMIIPHNEIYNFNPEDNFTISFWIRPISSSAYIIAKSTTETILPVPVYQPLNTTGSSQTIDVKSKPQYPFKVELDDRGAGLSDLKFSISDGTNTATVIGQGLTTGSLHHVVCMKSGSSISVWFSGSQKSTQSTNNVIYQTENKANVYVGSNGGPSGSDFFTGSISNLTIFNSARTEEQIKSLSSSINGSPYLGNIFYSHGLATITHPNHQKVLKPPMSTGYYLGFKNIHPIYENEYMCTINADEYNYTHNISTRKIKTDQHNTLSDFATGSLWKPYITTIGLYNEENELLVVGKLGQPIRSSDETDTTFVLRWDT
jgi:hypothetical protein